MEPVTWGKGGASIRAWGRWGMKLAVVGYGRRKHRSRMLIASEYSGSLTDKASQCAFTTDAIRLRDDGGRFGPDGPASRTSRAAKFCAGPLADITAVTRRRASIAT